MHLILIFYIPRVIGSINKGIVEEKKIHLKIYRLTDRAFLLGSSQALYLFVFSINLWFVQALR